MMLPRTTWPFASRIATSTSVGAETVNVILTLLPSLFAAGPAVNPALAAWRTASGASYVPASAVEAASCAITADAINAAFLVIGYLPF